MSLTPSKVTWDPNRYKAHEWVITYDSNGNAQLSKKEASYTGVNYNFWLFRFIFCPHIILIYPFYFV